MIVEGGRNLQCLIGMGYLVWVCMEKCNEYKTSGAQSQY